MALKGFQIGNPVFNELRPDELARIVPRIEVGGEDRIAQEIMPFSVKRFTFAYSLLAIGLLL
jgi:hypothetical protein